MRREFRGEPLGRRRIDLTITRCARRCMSQEGFAIHLNRTLVVVQPDVNRYPFHAHSFCSVGIARLRGASRANAAGFHPIGSGREPAAVSAQPTALAAGRNRGRYQAYGPPGCVWRVP